MSDEKIDKIFVISCDDFIRAHLLNNIQSHLLHVSHQLLQLQYNFVFPTAQYLTFTLLNFLNGFVYDPFLELSILEI